MRIDFNGITYHIFHVDEIEQARTCAGPVLIKRVCVSCGYEMYESLEHLLARKNDGCQVCLAEFLEKELAEKDLQSESARAQDALHEYDRARHERKLAIIDLDGVVANQTVRFERATRPDGSIDWTIAFDPSLVELDSIIDGTREAIRHMDDIGFSIVFLTSRPESMQIATNAWLTQHDLGCYELVCKPDAKKYVKTTVWKAEEVRLMVERLRYIHPSGIIVFIDDEQANRQAVKDLDLWVVCTDSLDDYKQDDRPIMA